MVLTLLSFFFLNMQSYVYCSLDYIFQPTIPAPFYWSQPSHSSVPSELLSGHHGSFPTCPFRGNLSQPPDCILPSLCSAKSLFILSSLSPPVGSLCSKLISAPDTWELPNVVEERIPITYSDTKLYLILERHQVWDMFVDTEYLSNTWLNEAGSR